MAFSIKQVHIILYRFPDADGTIDITDAGHVLWMLKGLPDLSIDVHDCSNLKERIGG